MEELFLVAVGVVALGTVVMFDPTIQAKIRQLADRNLAKGIEMETSEGRDVPKVLKLRHERHRNARGKKQRRGWN